MIKKKRAKAGTVVLLLGFLTLLLFSLPSFSAVRKNQFSSSDSIVALLKGPMQEVLKNIYKKGPEAYKKLRNISFSDQYPVGTRWKAFMALSQVGGKGSLPEIDQALTSKDWFMRNAGLLALEKIHFLKAVGRAKDMFVNDKALLVRAKALEVLQSTPNKKVRKLLWKELYSDKNYYRGKGLWIRKRIAQFLADYGEKSDLKPFLELVESEDMEDREIKPLIFPAIERLLGQASKKNLSAEGKVAYWTQRLKKALR